MSLTLDWPDAPGPRVLMLVANDITIDTRVRKTTSSIARAGYSVLSIGIDPRAASLPDETIDGALVVRVNDPSDPRISPRRFRLSKPELAHTTRHRVQTRKQRLHVARRQLSSDVAWASTHPPRWPARVGSITAGAARQVRLGDDLAGKIGRKVTQVARQADRSIRFGPLKARALYHQAAHQLLLTAARALARPGRPWLRHASWRSDLPELHRYEAVIGGLIDELRPDLIHVHDIFLLGVAARAGARARASDHPTKVLYDAHEYVAGLPIDSRRRDALTDLEREYFTRVDAAVTVSEGLAELLEQDYGLGRPAVVMNAPDVSRQIEVTPIRQVIGIDDDARLIVYVGGVAPHRGAEVLIQALELLADDIHLAFVTNSTTGYVARLATMADRAPLKGRVHFAPYVTSEGVVSYIRSASVSAVPLSREYMNYEIALPNKLFQSIHAGLPVVVSDNPEMKRFVTRHGVGEVFEGHDPGSLAKALQTTLDAPRQYAEALGSADLLRHISWEAQIETLVDVYGRLGVAPK